MSWAEIAQKFGGVGIVGLLVGLGLVTWVRPETEGGVALLLALPVLFALVFARLVSWAVAFLARKSSEQPEDGQAESGGDMPVTAVEEPDPSGDTATDPEGTPKPSEPSPPEKSP